MKEPQFEKDKILWVPKPFAVSASWPNSSIYWCILGCAFLGVLIGLGAGLSSSPVVATILPLLLTLIVGTGGLYITRVDASSFDPRKLRALGITLVVFAMVVFLSGWVGIYIRIQHQASGVSLESTDEISSTSEYLEILMLKIKLKNAGVAEADQKRIVELAISDLVRLKESVSKEEIQWYMSHLDISIGAIEGAISKANKEKKPAPPGDLFVYTQRLRGFRSIFLAWSNNSLNEPMPRMNFIAALKNSFYAVTQLSRFGEEENSWLRERIDIKPLRELFEKIDLDLQRNEKPNWMEGGDLSGAIERLESAKDKIPKRPKNNIEIMPTI